MEKKNITVAVTETSIILVNVEIDDSDSISHNHEMAIKKAKDMYNRCEIVLDYDNIISTEFKIHEDE